MNKLILLTTLIVSISCVDQVVQETAVVYGADWTSCTTMCQDTYYDLCTAAGLGCTGMQDWTVACMGQEQHCVDFTALAGELDFADSCLTQDFLDDANLCSQACNTNNNDETWAAYNACYISCETQITEIDSCGAVDYIYEDAINSGNDWITCNTFCATQFDASCDADPDCLTAKTASNALSGTLDACNQLGFTLAMLGDDCISSDLVVNATECLTTAYSTDTGNSIWDAWNVCYNSCPPNIIPCQVTYDQDVTSGTDWLSCVGVCSLAYSDLCDRSGECDLAKTESMTCQGTDDSCVLSITPIIMLFDDKITDQSIADAAVTCLSTCWPEDSDDEISAFWNKCYNSCATNIVVEGSSAEEEEATEEEEGTVEPTDEEEEGSSGDDNDGDGDETDDGESANIMTLAWVTLVALLAMFNL